MNDLRLDPARVNVNGARSLSATPVAPAVRSCRSAVMNDLRLDPARVNVNGARSLSATPVAPAVRSCRS
ncbi:hypothetical protein CKJ90_33085, partial [Klebsiella pneumoniae]